MLEVVYMEAGLARLTREPGKPDLKALLHSSQKQLAASFAGQFPHFISLD
jgi:hypothetical protein